MGEFLKSLKTFETSDMDDRINISSGNSINFDNLTKRYAHSSGGWKKKTTPTDISPLRPLPDASNYLSSIFVRFDIDEVKNLHLSET